MNEVAQAGTPAGAPTSEAFKGRPFPAEQLVNEVDQPDLKRRSCSSMNEAARTVLPTEAPGIDAQGNPRRSAFGEARQPLQDRHLLRPSFLDAVLHEDERHHAGSIPDDPVTRGDHRHHFFTIGPPGGPTLSQSFTMQMPQRTQGRQATATALRNRIFQEDRSRPAFPEVGRDLNPCSSKLASRKYKLTDP